MRRRSSDFPLYIIIIKKKKLRGESIFYIVPSLPALQIYSYTYHILLTILLYFCQTSLHFIDIVYRHFFYSFFFRYEKAL